MVGLVQGWRQPAGTRRGGRRAALDWLPLRVWRLARSAIHVYSPKMHPNLAAGKQKNEDWQWSEWEGLGRGLPQLPQLPQP